MYPSQPPIPLQGVDGGQASATFDVPAGKVFVLEDNRANSCDSHVWSDPYVPIENVLWEVVGVYFPTERARVVRYGRPAPASSFKGILGMLKRP